MKKTSRVMSLLLCLSLLLNMQLVRAADPQSSASNWSFNSIVLEHKVVKFTVGNVAMAQDATLHIESTTLNINMLIPFSINSAIENFSLELPDDKYLPAGTYTLYIGDKAGNFTSKKTGYLSKHSLYSNNTAYPNCLVIKNCSELVTQITVTVGFQKVQGKPDSNGNAIIEYPKQTAGTIISVKWEDGYGCFDEDTVTVEDKLVSIPYITVWKENIFLSYDELDNDERICVDVNGTVYYGEYNLGASKYQKIISYPAIDSSITKINVWVESSFGSASGKKEYDVSKCALDKCKYYVTAFPRQAKGVIEKNMYEQIPTKVYTVINNKEYSANIDAEGKFQLDYPEQERGDYITLIYKDNHGCAQTQEEVVYNTLACNNVDIEYQNIFPSGITAYVPAGAKLCVEINGEVFSSAYATKDQNVKLSYPKQAVGTKINVWYESPDTSKSEVIPYQIYDKKYEISINGRTTLSSGEIHTGYLDICKVAAVYAEVGGNRYPVTFKKMSTNDKSESDIDSADVLSIDGNYYEFQVSYPLQPVGTTIQIIVEDEDGYSVSKAIVLNNIAPKISVEKIDSSSSKIYGETKGSSLVSVAIGKKTYKVNSKKDGSFAISIKQQKAGTKVKISVRTPEGYTATKSIKVNKTNSGIKIRKNVYRTSGSVSLNISNAKKGDKIILKVGSSTYTKKLNANKKKQNITMKLSKAHSAGSKVKATLYDKFGGIKDYYSDIVYFGKSIYKGMSAKDAVLTTWGPPVRKNDWGTGEEQWVFESGYTTLYVYVSGGKVTSIQKINF